MEILTVENFVREIALDYLDCMNDDVVVGMLATVNSHHPDCRFTLAYDAERAADVVVMEGVIEHENRKDGGKEVTLEGGEFYIVSQNGEDKEGVRDV